MLKYRVQTHSLVLSPLETTSELCPYPLVNVVKTAAILVDKKTVAGNILSSLQGQLNLHKWRSKVLQRLTVKYIFLEAMGLASSSSLTAALKPWVFPTFSWELF